MGRQVNFRCKQMSLDHNVQVCVFFKKHAFIVALQKLLWYEGIQVFM